MLTRDKHNVGRATRGPNFIISGEKRRGESERGRRRRRSLSLASESFCLAGSADESQQDVIGRNYTHTQVPVARFAAAVAVMACETKTRVTRR